MTTSHPTPGSFAQAHPGRVGVASRSRAGARRRFFEPGANRVSGDAEGARQAAQRRAFFVGAQNLLALRFAIAKRLRMVTTAPLAVFTVIALFAISGQAVAQQIFTAAMVAFNRDCNHRVSLSSLTLLSHYRKSLLHEETAKASARYTARNSATTFANRSARVTAGTSARSSAYSSARTTARGTAQESEFLIYAISL
jgi:hypothetical protein